MAEQTFDIFHLCAVTISRQYGSGGGEIARRLAQQLDWQLIDHEIVARVAREVGVSESEVESEDERTESFIARVVSAMLLAAPPEYLVVVPPILSITEQQRLYHEAARHVIEEAARTRRVVIVGRGAQVLLGSRRDVVHIRVVAPLAKRIRYVMRRESLDEAAARDRIEHKDRDRTHFLQSEYHRHPNDPLLYDLIINTGVLDLDTAVDLIVLAMRRSAKLMGVPDEELGPGAGMDSYAGRPSDLRAPGGA